MPDILWAGTESSFEEAQKLLAKVEALTTEEKAEITASLHSGEEEEFYNPLLSRATVGDTEIGIISIEGSLIPGNSEYALWFGMTPYGLIQQAAEEAAMDDTLDGVLVDIASGGGTVTGIPSALTGLNVLRSQKELRFHTSDNMHSAAMWIGMSGGKVTAGAMADLGSIGVIAMIPNYSKQLESRGVSYKIMRSGDKKARINPIETPRQEDLDDLQAKMDYSHGVFIDGIAEGRGMASEQVRSRVGDGREFNAEEALRLGMVDGIMEIDDALRSFASSLNGEGKTASPRVFGGGVHASSSTQQLQASNMEANMPGKSRKPAKVITKEAQAAILEGADPEAVVGDVEATVEEQTVEAAAEGAEVEAPAEAAAAKVDPESKVSLSVTDRLVQMATDLGSEKAKVATLEAQISADSAVLGAFSEIVRESVARMHVGLGKAATDLSSCTNQVLLDTYTSTQADLQKRFPVGQQASTDQTEEGVSDSSPAYTNTLVSLVQRSK